MGYLDRNKQRAFARDWIKRRRNEWFEANGPCHLCGSWERLEVDHIDPAQKVTHRVWSWRAERRQAELAKCRPLCHRCHKARSAKQKSESVPWRHGHRSTYKRGCRCELCTHAAVQYNRELIDRRRAKEDAA